MRRAINVRLATTPTSLVGPRVVLPPAATRTLEIHTNPHWTGRPSTIAAPLHLQHRFFAGASTTCKDNGDESSNKDLDGSIRGSGGLSGTNENTVDSDEEDNLIHSASNDVDGILDLDSEGEDFGADDGDDDSDEDGDDGSLDEDSDDEEEHDNAIPEEDREAEYSAYHGICIDAGMDIPQELQQAVDDALQDPKLHAPLATKRHMVRHHRLDSRKAVHKKRKRALKASAPLPIVTPYLLIGAYQILLERLIDEQVDEPFQTARQALQNVDKPFEWFEELAKSSFHWRKQSGPTPYQPSNERIAEGLDLIVFEALAILLRPKIAPFLPDYAWSSEYLDLRVNPMEPKPVVQKAIELALKEDENPGGTLSVWNLTIHPKTEIFDECFLLGTLSHKMVQNMLRAYLPEWLCHALNRSFNGKAVGTRKQREWSLPLSPTSTATTTSLHPLLIDAFLMQVDHEQGLTRLTARDGGAYSRYGPILVLKTPSGCKAETREKMERRIEYLLKSHCQMDKRRVGKSFSTISVKQAMHLMGHNRKQQQGERPERKSANRK